MLIDTHTHINNVKDLDFLLEKCKENRVTELIAISTDINSSRENIKISKKYENIFCAVGFPLSLASPRPRPPVREKRLLCPSPFLPFSFGTHFGSVSDQTRCLKRPVWGPGQNA